MACLAMPLAEAIVMSVVTKAVERKEKKLAALNPEKVSENTKVTFDGKIKLSEKLKWLNGMLYGGAALLAFEHVWHGEISPFFPFLTAANDPAELQVAVNEILTSGTAMAAIVTAVWLGIVVVTGKIEKKNANSHTHAETSHETAEESA